jgi:diguanylate cyclase (GGDEF)-like protein
MTTVDVLLVGLDEAAEQELARDDDFRVRRIEQLDQLELDPGIDAVVLDLDGHAPLEALKTIRDRAPEAAVVVVTDPASAADGTVALHAGAEDHLLQGPLLTGLLPRAVRYAVEMRRLRRELATSDEITALPNLRGFVPIADHHLRMADRTGNAVIFVFVRLEDYSEVVASRGQSEADELTREASNVILDAIRDSDAPARIGPDTFVVLLAGAGEGAESLVLSRLVEAIALHDAARDRPRALSLAVGTARYEPGSATPLSHILEAAERRMAGRAVHG